MAAIYKICNAWSIVEYYLRKMKTIDIDLVDCLSKQNVPEKTVEAIQLCKQLLPNAIETSQQVKIIDILAR